MQPTPAAAAWEIPPIESVAALAAWFEVSVNDLLWLADLRGLSSKSGNARLDHYHYRALTKPSGHSFEERCYALLSPSPFVAVFLSAFRVPSLPVPARLPLAPKDVPGKISFAPDSAAPGSLRKLLS